MDTRLPRSAYDRFHGDNDEHLDADEPAYPEWQKTIRAAQVEDDFLKCWEQAIEDDQERDASLQLGIQLREVLAMFGISTDPPPTENRVLIDEFIFGLGTRGTGGGWGLERWRDDPEKVRFALYVWYNYPAEIPWDELPSGNSHFINVNWNTVGVEERARLARILDVASERGNAFLRSRAARQLAKPNETKAPPSTAEQLVALIETLANDVYERRTQY